MGGLPPACLSGLQVLCQLPPKTEETVRVPFTESQRAAYASLVSEFRDAQDSSAPDLADSDMTDDAEPTRTSSLLLNREAAMSATSSNGGAAGGTPKRPKRTISDLNTGETLPIPAPRCLCRPL